jgi:nucleoside-diphosphate-sugar epimerase
VGRQLAIDLSSANKVRALVRNSRSLAALLSESLSTGACDLDSVESLSAQFAGVDVVVHAAGFVDTLGKRQEIFKVNVQGTANVLKAAQVAGVKQVILISSLSVITGQGDQFDVNESAPLRLCGEAYADSKVEAEKLALEYMRSCKETGAHLNVTILRPGFIYGPYERAWLPRLINSLREGKAMLIDGGLRQTNVVYVGNLAKAVALCLMNPRAFNETFNITDAQVVTKKELFDTVAGGLGLKPARRSIPRWLFRLVSDAVCAIAPRLSPARQKALSRFSKGAFRLAAVNQGFSVKKAQNVLNYNDLMPFSQAMAITLEYFRENQE